MIRISGYALLGLVSLAVACDSEEPAKDTATMRLAAVVRVPQSSNDVVLAFKLQNRMQHVAKVVVLNVNDAKFQTIGFLEWQLFKEGKAIAFDVVTDPPFFDKRNLRELKSGDSISIAVNLSHHYTRATLAPGEYEMRIKYKLRPGSEDAAYWREKLGVTAMTIEESIWVIVEKSK